MSGVAAPVRKTMPPRLGRSDRSAVGRWFWEIDKLLLILVAVLISIGLVAVAAASPAAARRLSGTGFQVPSSIISTGNCSGSRSACR